MRDGSASNCDADQHLGPIHADVSAGDLFLVNGMLGPIVARLRTASDRARSILGERWSEVEAIADALEKTGYLAGAEIDALLDTAKFDLDAVRNGPAMIAQEVR